jgi:hypothetical protein
MVHLAAPLVLLGDEGLVEMCLVYLEIVLISRQDMCTICAKCSIGSEIALDTPDGTPR